MRQVCNAPTLSVGDKGAHDFDCVHQWRLEPTSPQSR
jgi:hypothetical protein